MTRFGDRIKVERIKRGLSQPMAAKMIGAGRAAYSKTERGDTVRPNDWEAYAEKLGIPLDEADQMISMDADDEGKTTKASGLRKKQQNASGSPKKRGKQPPPSAIARQWKEIPVSGLAAAGDPDRLIMVNDVTEMVLAHPALLGINDGYAIDVHGTSMIPRYYPGERVYVHPFKGINERDFCVVQVGDKGSPPDGGYIKQFIGWQDDGLHLFQFNPPKEIVIPAEKVIATHRIIGTGVG